MKSMNINNGNSKQGGQTVNIDQSDVTFAECECGNDTFQQAQKLGKLSKVHPKNPSGQTALVPFPVNICTDCGVALDMSTLAE